MSKRYCSECGKELSESNKFCPDCGTKIDEEVSNKENNISKIKEEILNKERNLNKNHKIIIGMGILIIAILLMLFVFGVFGGSPSHIKDVKVYKADKIYKIEFSCDIPHDDVLVTLYKDGQALNNSKGSLGEWSDGDSSVAIELVKDVDIDEILFTVYDNDFKVLDKGFIKDFEIDKKGSMSDIGVYRVDNSQTTANDVIDDYEIAKSHRDKYDYDHDGMLNDYEFEQFCIGEGQEELLDY